MVSHVLGNLSYNQFSKRRTTLRDAAPQGTYKVQALDRAFAVLDLLGESDTPLGLAQVSSSLQLHKSTAHRFLMVLERHRMVARMASFALD